jgi:hypothetical protein
MTIAQKFVPVEVRAVLEQYLSRGIDLDPMQLWVPFFNAIQFVLGVRFLMP